MLFDCREVGLEPTGDTYTVLMCELGNEGDIDGIEKVCDNVLHSILNLLACFV